MDDKTEERVGSDEELRDLLNRCLEYLDRTGRLAAAARLSHCIDLLMDEIAAKGAGERPPDHAPDE